MRGEILTYDDGSGTGLISGDDGVRYTFVRADLQQLTPVRAGTKVDFVPVDGAATQIFVVSAAQAERPAGYVPGVAGSGATFDWRALFLEANGRIGQKDYWIGFGIVFAVNIVLSWLPLIGFLVSLAAIYAGVCVSSKRLHDMGRSGWLAAIPYGALAAAIVFSTISVIGMIGAANYDNGMGFMAGAGALGLLWTAASLISLGFVIWLGVTPGQPGDNRYGPPPKPLANF
ncbi:hypothetical protein BH10PSE1_BH10PSE1_01060 [soil metagenome]